MFSKSDHHIDLRRPSTQKTPLTRFWSEIISCDGDESFYAIFSSIGQEIKKLAKSNILDICKTYSPSSNYLQIFSADAPEVGIIIFPEKKFSIIPLKKTKNKISFLLQKLPLKNFASENLTLHIF